MSNDLANMAANILGMPPKTPIEDNRFEKLVDELEGEIARWDFGKNSTALADQFTTQRERYNLLLEAEEAIKVLKSISFFFSEEGRE